MTQVSDLPKKTDSVTQDMFDEVRDRKHSDSSKWNFYDEDILPMWVADMDFASPRVIVDALQARAAEGLFGYGKEPESLRAVICARMEELYRWRVSPEQIYFLPGLVCGLNLVARASDERGSGILVNTPVYGPFLSAPANQERELQEAPLALTHRHDGRGRSYLHYELDMDALYQALQPNTRMFTFCNPHNPVGRAYTLPELEQIADFCLRNNLTICSDEIHCDLLLDGTRHIPIASISPELAENSITLLSPSKTFNMPGLGCSLAIIPNSELRQRVQRAAAGIVPHVNLLGFVAAEAAYAKGGPWLGSLKEYLTANRNIVFDFFKQNLPRVEMTLPEATYLAWLDFRGYGIDDPFRFFFDRAKVALGSGISFGPAGQGYARLNFGAPRSLLMQGLEQIAAAVNESLSSNTAEI